MNALSPVPSRLQRAVSRGARDRNAQVAAGAAVATGATVIAGRIAIKAAQRNGHPGPSRAYRLKRNEKTAKGLRRIARGRVEDAVEQLRDRPDGGEAAVHEARKDLKKLRSVLRLVRGEIGKSTFRRENARYRGVGRTLSDARDAEVKLQTLTALRERSGDLDGVDDYATGLQDAREHARADGAGVLAGAARAIEEGGASIATWSLPGGSWAPVGAGFVDAYADGRKAMRRARKAPDDEEAVHEWRKRSKDLWYHLRILEPVWPEVLDPLTDQAHELSDLLGDHHDLAVLRADARTRPGRFAGGDQRALMDAIRTRQDELLSRAFPLGERLYAEKPKAYRRRMNAYWKAARA